MTVPTAPEARALVVVDVQNDFCEGGSLAVTGGAATAAAISEHLRTEGARYTAVVATRDLHVDPGAHFSDHPDLVDSWPPHCVAGTPGADPHPALDTGAVQAWFDKGAHEAAYSGFEGTAADGSGLGRWLADRMITAVDVVGIATDHCVRATVLDALAGGLSVRVLLPLTAGVAPATTAAAVAAMRAAGAEIVDG